MGETGTGKDLIANALHYNSPRKDAPFIAVNCGAIPKELMEREFFGHVKGAYTGAHQDREGYFEKADGGTLFLDEIGELDKSLQVKLLRALERGEINRVGTSETTKVDVRLIAASNKDLRAEVQEGNFREDLYYRIYVLPVQVPPLRDRKEDIPLLVEHFIKKIQSESKIELPSLSEKEMSLLLHYSYPGNVRELEHIIERFCFLGSSAGNLLNDLPESPGKPSPSFFYDEILSSVSPLKKAREHTERDIITHTLTLCDNDYGVTAKKLNICLASLYKKVKEYGVNQ
jgi:transcriptional regulator with PAS, ATPase and Fis domain